jgi:hypothetical protein
MPRMGFEPTIPVFERAKSVHALDREATVIGQNVFTKYKSSVTRLVAFLDFVPSLLRS